ncbi:GIY-YIG nuclease family protein [Lawsonibacter sp. JLR.KK007]|uniref:GIY-YIG nuclease family protein n=1 Tax=Lawsonibacter sp. JLR.KK007 TaxID=3114293 RepID=UPI002FF3D1E2
MDLFGKKAAKEKEELQKKYEGLQQTSLSLQKRNQELQSLLTDCQQKLDSLGYSEYEQIRAEINRTKDEIASLRQKAKDEIEQDNAAIATLRLQIEELSQVEQKLQKQTKTATNKLAKSKELYKSVEYAISCFFNSSPQMEGYKLSASDSTIYDELAPSVILKLHSMDIKSLRKAYKDNDKQIENILSKYASRYTTKANQTIYKLMVIALRAELQNILYNLKYEKLDVAIEQVKNMTAKYLSIASEGNQSIAGTLTKFIGEIEYLFINAVKIEYNYYVKKEQARQEQLAIREQMRQEAAERKALEAERKKIEAEESKYTEEINRIKQQLEEAAENDAASLNKRILELEAMLSDVTLKKEEIVNLQNGRAGNVYVISNLGSFGENMFKIGMTRRLDPQDRIDELGSASVPFKFDVHCFIFSEDAVSLENRLHQALNDKRVNKVNLRKEFFFSNIDELESLVASIDPTAAFNRTMLAEEFRQSQSVDTAYTTEYTMVEEDDDE